SSHRPPTTTPRITTPPSAMLKMAITALPPRSPPAAAVLVSALAPLAPGPARLRSAPLHPPRSSAAAQRLRRSAPPSSSASSAPPLLGANANGRLASQTRAAHCALTPYLRY